MSFLPVRVAPMARPMLASARAFPPAANVPRMARLASGWATDWPYRHEPPPKVYPGNYKGTFDELKDDRELELEPIAMPLHLPGEKPSEDPKLNGYPDVPRIHARDKPITARYWNRQMRHNYGEVLHEEAEALSMWAPDPISNYSGWTLWKPWLVLSGFCVVAYWIIGFTVPQPQALPRAFPAGYAESFPGWPVPPTTDDDVYKLAEEDITVD